MSKSAFKNALQMTSAASNMAFHMSKPEMAVLQKCQNEVHQVNPRTPTERDPSKRMHRRKEIMQYRDELRAASLEFVTVRRSKLLRLLTADAIQQIRWMRDIDYDYVSTQA